MKQLLTLCLALSGSALACAESDGTPEGNQFERRYPTAVTAEEAHNAADLRRAIEAYKFFFPTLGSEAVMQQMLSNGAVINEVGHVMATTPLQQFGGANADTPYALTTVAPNTLFLASRPRS